MARMIDSAWALGSYHGVLRDLIRSLKYQQRRSVLPCIAAFLREAQSQLPAVLQQAELAVPVPLHPDKEAKRGFNQTELIFRGWLAAQQLPMRRCLCRTRPTQPQYGLSASERRHNMKGAFALTDGRLPALTNDGLQTVSDMVHGRHILLLDDILTTGSTLAAGAQVLQRAGAASVVVLVLASDRK